MNEVSLVGKVSRVGQLKYSPTGVASVEFTLAVPQKVLEVESVGYFEVVLFGPPAEDSAGTIRIGKKLSVRGHLWGRSYRNRQGGKVVETKVICAGFVLAGTNA